MSSFGFCHFMRDILFNSCVSFAFKHSQEFVDREMCICITNLVFKGF